MATGVPRVLEARRVSDDVDAASSDPTYILKHGTNGMVLRDRELEYDFTDGASRQTC